MGTLAGSWMAIWYSPAEPVARTELTTGTSTPPTVTTGSVDVAGAPVTRPNPVAHNTTRSQGCAGVTAVTGV